MEFIQLAKDDQYTMGIIDYSGIAQSPPFSICKDPGIYECYISGGAALTAVAMAISNRFMHYSDIDIWVPDGILATLASITPKNKQRESSWATTYYDNWATVQVMKINPVSPRELVEAFDMSICRVCLFDITSESCRVLIHNHVISLLTGNNIIADVGTPNAIRMVKYARKFCRPLEQIFTIKDMSDATGGLMTAEEVEQWVLDHPEESQYHLLQHLDSLRPSTIELNSVFSF